MSVHLIISGDPAFILIQVPLLFCLMGFIERQVEAVTAHMCYFRDGDIAH